MEGPEDKMNDIEKKRKELRTFFADSKYSEEAIERVIENELRPLKEEKRAYITASAPGIVKTEYEVMTGQPFTQVEDQDHPLSNEEIKELLKDSSIITEKARQIQIVTHSSERKEIAVPIDEINLAGYDVMRREIESAGGDRDQVNNINYKHMQALAKSLSDYKIKCAKPEEPIPNTAESNFSDTEQKEFEAIENEVSKYTDKSYETRYQETKDMLLEMADRYDDPRLSNEAKEIGNIGINKNPVLKQSSVHVIKGQRRQTTFEQVKETYSINKAMNIPMKDNPVMPDLSGVSKNVVETKMAEDDCVINVDEVFPKSLEAKLKDTQKALREINSVLNNCPRTQPNEQHEIISTNNIEPLAADSVIIQEPQSNQQRYDEKMEQTLHNALENIFETKGNENNDNKEMEFKEMKSLAKNIVEGADNLSTLIREDITNKLNSMNELLNDVNVALENSRQSNIAYQKIHEEGEILRERALGNTAIITEVTEAKEELNKTSNCSVTDEQIDDIHNAIGKLNAEIKCHENRINESKVRYEQRNEECKSFIKEVDQILLKSNEILRPVNASSIELEKSLVEKTAEEVTKEKEEKDIEKGEKFRKELWDIDIEYKDDRNKKLAEFKKQELDRNKRINDLLYGIKDKMKDNKDVLKLANNLLRREESRKKILQENTKNIRELPGSEIDANAQGDHVGADNETDKTTPHLTSTDGEAIGSTKLTSIVDKGIDLKFLRYILAKDRNNLTDLEKALVSNNKIVILFYKLKSYQSQDWLSRLLSSNMQTFYAILYW